MNELQSYAYDCIEITEKRILVIGQRLIKIFSLETYKELTGHSNEDTSFKGLMTPDRKYIFISTAGSKAALTRQLHSGKNPQTFFVCDLSFDAEIPKSNFI